MRYDLISPRTRNGKTYWTKIGAAFPRDKGGFSLTFDALPLPDEKGEVRVLMVEPKQRDTQQSQPSNDWPDRSGGGGMDQEIPFAAEWRI